MSPRSAVICPRASIATTRSTGPARRRPTSTRGVPTSRACIGAARVLESIFASDYHGLQMSAEQRGARFSAKAYYTFGRAREISTTRAAGCPRCRTRTSSSWSVDAPRPIARTAFTFSGIFIVDHFGNSSPVVRALLNGWTLSTIVTLQSGTPLTITVRARSQLRRPDQRSRRHHRRSQARQRPAA